MRFFLSFAKNNGRATWLLALLLVGLGWLRPQVAQATHIRAGDIQSRVDDVTGNPNHILFRLTIYRDKNSQVPQDLGDTDIYFGDRSKLNGADKDASGNPLMTRTVDAARSTVDTEVLLFDFDHFFPGAGTYKVSFIGENRNANIVNMANSVNTSFYINSEVIVYPPYGLNHSPVLRAPALDRAAAGQVFLHNPAAYDADGDSLAFKLQDCQQVIGGRPAVGSSNIPKPVPCTNYTYPDNQALAPGAKQVPYNGVPASKGGDPAIIVQDVQTGQITWNAPARTGIYNIAFIVEEWRRRPDGVFTQIGWVVRDMQIIVTPTDNLPPILTVPPDVCVVANTPVTLRISATDGTGPNAQAPTPVTLFAYSGILPPTATNPAAFVQNTTGTTSTGTFTWTPDCSRVSNQPYSVVFKAQDSPPNPNVTTPILIDEKTVRITVVGPPPQNVRAVASSSAGLISLVTWDRYSCQNAKNLLIFRREGCYDYTPGPCETGLPAGSGYVQVGSVPVTATTFADDNNGQGLTRGKSYSYRVYAVFPLPSGGVSIVSNEACLAFTGRSAMLTNVDVNTTDAATGQITVKWTRPRADNGGAFGAPLGYRLSRSVAGGPPVLAATLTSLADTVFVDKGLNTTANQYTYTLTFFNTDNSTGTAVEKTETSPTATSVRTSLVPDGLAKTITVNWAYNVPWDNSQQPSRIYRRDTPTGTFNQIGTFTPGATSGTYVDRAVTTGQEYCYYVQTTGQYAGVPYLLNLLNNSQQICTTLQATPCTPVLSIKPTNCDSLANLPSYPAANQRYQNDLRWTVGDTPAGCAANAVYYRVFRGATEAGPFVLLDSTNLLTYSDRNLPQATYCYQVQAVAASGQRSGLSNVACQNDCVFFLLPNIFTPNGDNINDTFHPKTTSPIKTTHIQIFDRWGRKMYDSSADPYINWTGAATGEGNTNGLVSNGIYYYLAEVEFADAANTKRSYKGWVEVVR